ncbi:MAG: ABC transporter permease [Chryseolinea sp.]
MLKNYLILGLRNLFRHPAFSILNIAGLATGMAACFVLIQFVRFENSYDDFNTNAKDIYRLSLALTTDQNARVEVPKNFSALGPALKNQFPEIKNYVRIFPIDGTMALKLGDKAFNEKRIVFADANIFDVFTFPMVSGDSSTALKAPYSIVLTETAARKYFDQGNPIGQQIRIIEGNIDVNLIVTGVIKDVPENSHIDFDFLISHATLSALWGERADQSWNEALFYTYIQLERTANANFLIDKLNSKLLSDYTHWNVKLDFIVQPLPDIYLYSHMVQEAKVNGNARQVNLLWVIAIMIVALSWINYINISTARYLERAKEVGVRKIIGARKAQLVIQFVTESMLITLLSLIIAAAFIQLSAPAIASFTGKVIPLWNDPKIVVSISSLFIVGSLIAATFPSLVLSSLNTVRIIKGKLRSSNGAIALRKSLIVFQFMSAAMIMGGTFIVYLQLEFIRTADLGAEVGSTIILPTPDITDSTYFSKANYFKSQLMNHPGIEWAVSSTSIPGKQDNIVQGGLSKFENADKEGINHYRFGVDRSFIDAYKMKVIAGRNFAATGDDGSVVINETAAHLLGFFNAEDAIGHKIVASWTPGKTVIGVVADFHQHSLKVSIEPIVLQLDERAEEGYYSIKLKPGFTDSKAVIASIRRNWQHTFEGNPFDYFFLDNFYNEQYKDDVRFGRVLIIFSVLGLTIACLGIFGLSIFSASQRTKEISIRKVVGASAANILTLLTKDYLRLILISLAIATPLTYFLSTHWLDGYAFHLDLEWWMLAVPGLLIAVVSVLTISSQSMKAVFSNPAKNLNA